MNSTAPLRAVLLGHGDLASGMVDAVRAITGIGEEALVPLSNRGLSPETLAEQVQSQLGDGPAIVFTDLQSGSCSFVARRLIQANPELVVVSGANLSVLLEFVMKRELPLDELIPRLLARGRAAICCTPAGPESHEHRPVSS
jgi:PTS system N-acetylgalactosamine-specific IIA component